MMSQSVVLRALPTSPVSLHSLMKRACTTAERGWVGVGGEETGLYFIYFGVCGRQLGSKVALKLQICVPQVRGQGELVGV